MILQMFAVYDRSVGAFMTPFFMHSKGQAIRSFSDSANEPNSMMNKHPQDFSLFHLGTYDDSEANFETIHPISIGTASEFLKTVS